MDLINQKYHSEEPWREGCSKAKDHSPSPTRGVNLIEIWGRGTRFETGSRVSLKFNRWKRAAHDRGYHSRNLYFIMHKFSISKKSPQSVII